MQLFLQQKNSKNPEGRHSACQFHDWNCDTMFVGILLITIWMKYMFKPICCSDKDFYLWNAWREQFEEKIARKKFIKQFEEAESYIMNHWNAIKNPFS